MKISNCEIRWLLNLVEDAFAEGYAHGRFASLKQEAYAQNNPELLTLAAPLSPTGKIDREYVQERLGAWDKSTAKQRTVYYQEGREAQKRK